MQHMKKENRRKPSVFAGFVAGAEGLGLGCRLGRFAAERHWRSLTPRHALRRAQPCLVAESLCALTKNREASIVLASLFLAGAEGLEPSARGFGVDVGKCSKEQGRAGVARFLPQVRKGAVLVWCWEEIIRAKTGEKERKIPAKAGNTLTKIDNVRIIKNAGETRRASVADRRLATPFYSTQRGGDADGKQPQGESPAIRGMLGHCFGAGHSVCPKSVLTARLASERST